MIEVTSLAKLTARLDRIPRPQICSEPDEFGNPCQWAHFDIETTLNGAGLLTCRLVHAGALAPEEIVEVAFT